uniref:Uncharacterized protein n=1 Tax=Panthera leo TaxID=9689 RepID=A0A8C8WUY9_PANLE
MDAIHGNGTFWHCWSQDFVALALTGQIFRSQGYPHQVNRTGSELYSFRLCVYLSQASPCHLHCYNLNWN